MFGITGELKKVLHFRVVLPVILLSIFFFTQFLLAPRKILTPSFTNHCISPWDFECLATLVDEFGCCVSEEDLILLGKKKKEQYAVMVQKLENSTEYQKAKGMAECIEQLEEKIKMKTGYTEKEAEKEYEKNHKTGFYTGIYRYYYKNNLMKKEISLLETAGDFTVNDMSYLSVWIQAVIFLVLLHYWRRQDAAVHKKDRIYAGVVCSVLITAILLLCYQLCGTGLGFWNFRDCPMEYGILYFPLPFWGYVLLLNLWILVFTAGHGLVVSVFLSGAKTGWKCVGISAVFAVAAGVSCRHFLFVTEKLPLVCPEVVYLVLVGVIAGIIVRNKRKEQKKSPSAVSQKVTGK